MQSERDLLHEARRALGIDRFVLVVHDASFPGADEEDIGRGSPYSQGAAALYAWADALGFTGIQLGPQGETSKVNPSPYDGTVFAKSVLSIALHPLVHDPSWGQLLDASDLEDVVRRRPGSRTYVQYTYVYEEQRRLLRKAFATFVRRREENDRGVMALARRLDAVHAREHWWLEQEALFEALALAHFTEDWREWREGTQPDEAEVAFATFCQLVVHAQHDELRLRLGALGQRAATDEREPRGLALHGDLQIGISWRDRWQREGLFLRGYALGAPPSRTNPEGQPWGYPLLDPSSAAALDFFRARVTKMLRELDGIRVDHPHGHVCPWVYRDDTPDAMAAVQAGARLFESPDLPDHPELAALAIARPNQVDRGVARYADGWVTELDEAQVDAYARRWDALMEAARDNGRSRGDVVCEVLSTSPYPLRRVMDRYGLGRFRVTQKAKPDDATDSYRTDHAVPRDWVMLGNHDTPPIWLAVRGWNDEAKLLGWCAYLEAHLGEGAVDRSAVLSDPTALIEPMFADLFACPARNVLVFFPDLLGQTEIYNRPGVIHPDNWMLRIMPDFREDHRARVGEGRALGIARAFAMALRARAAAGAAPHENLIERLETLEPAPTPQSRKTALDRR